MTLKKIFIFTLMFIIEIIPCIMHGMTPQQKAGHQLAEKRLNALISDKENQRSQSAHLFIVSNNPNEMNDDHYQHIYEAMIKNINWHSSKHVYCICTRSQLLSFIKDDEDYFKNYIKNATHEDAIKKLISHVYSIKDTPYFLILPQQQPLHSIPFLLNSCIPFPLAQQKSKIKKLNENFTNWINNCWEKSATLKDGVLAAPPSLTNALQKIFPFQQQVYTSLLDIPLNWHIFLIGHGSNPKYISKHYQNTSGEIASIPMPEFLRLLRFFNTINTQLMEIASCYTGGKNREYIVGKGVGQSSFYAHLVFPTLHYPLVLLSSNNALAYFYTRDPAEQMNRFQSISHYANWIQVITDELFNSQGFSFNQQVNRMPLILYPYHTSFDLIIPAALSTREKNIFGQSTPHPFWSSLFLINNVTTKKHLISQEPMLIKNKKIIVSNQLIHQHLLEISSPQINFTPASKAHGASNHVPYRDWLLKAKHKINQNIINQQNIHELKEWDFNAVALFPVAADYVTYDYYPSLQKTGFPRPTYPLFFSLQSGEAAHYFERITLTESEVEKKQHIPGRRGIFLLLRDMFLNVHSREVNHLYFIRELNGINDLPKEVANMETFKKMLPTHEITLTNIALKTSATYDHANKTMNESINLLFTSNNHHYMLNHSYTINHEEKNAKTGIIWKMIQQISEVKRNQLLLAWEKDTVDQRKKDEEELAVSTYFDTYEKRTNEFSWQQLKKVKKADGKLAYQKDKPLMLQVKELHTLYSKHTLNENWPSITKALEQKKASISAQSKPTLETSLRHLNDKLKQLQEKLQILKRQLSQLKSTLAR